MDPFETSHFSNDALLLEARKLVGQRSKATAVLLTRLAEIDSRQLYRREGYSSMYAYCVGELHLLEDSAYRHIHVARIARQYPRVLIALAEGGMCMRAVLMLASHLTSANADELVAAASRKTRFEIQKLLADRFPQPDLPEWLQAIPAAPGATPMAVQPVREQHDQLAPERVQVTIPEQDAHEIEERSSTPAPQSARAQAEAPVARPRVTPLAPERFGLQVTLDQETYELLQKARALMSHQNPKGEILPVLKRALESLVAQLEKQKFGATERPGRSRGCTSARGIPAAVKRAVRERDGDRCTFVSDSGRRCPERSRLEFDHLDPVARGGEATADNVRLLCRAHNQYAAECVFGSDFMDDRRREAGAGRPWPR